MVMLEQSTPNKHSTVLNTLLILLISLLKTTPGDSLLNKMKKLGVNKLSNFPRLISGRERNLNPSSFIWRRF